MSPRILTVRLASTHDIVTARQRARQVAALVGLEPREQTQLATAVSEVARNACEHGGGGEVEFSIEGDCAPQLLQVRVCDHGPGIADLDAVVEGVHAGMGLASSRRLVDRLVIRSLPGEGTQVTLSKIIPASAPVVGSQRIAALAAQLSLQPSEGPLAELDTQNRELARVLDELRERQETVTRLSRELEDTNRGVVALYAELDERAEQLRRADEIKTRFFSSMSHELRTPLNSIRALSRMLLDRADGPLADEQAKQVAFIRKAADDLMQIVDDLLELAKIAAGKSEVQPSTFSIGELFGVLRGMLRPLLANERVVLRFEDPTDLPALHTDEAKLSQIMRNLLSNALKFTEQGEVRVAATACPGGERVLIRVSDTGIGIRPEDKERIFEEVTQIANPLQARMKGTGLGLPLCRRLAALLGGELQVESEPGQGSTFILTIPMRYAGGAVSEPVRSLPDERPGETPDASVRARVLIIDDDPGARYAIRRLLGLQQDEAIEVATGTEGLRAAALGPDLILLDLQLPDMSGEQVLQELRNAERTRMLPVVVITSMMLGDDERARLERLGASVRSKRMLEDPSLGAALRRSLARTRRAPV